MLLSSERSKFMANECDISVTLLYSPAARQVREIALRLAPNSTLQQALQASGLQPLLALLDQPKALLGVWGRKTGLNHVLRDHDRVEVYRALSVDPKLARRTRFAKQGVRTAGLFINRRAGSKAGY